MKELPILFSGAMVRAILDGSKTQTRRVVTPQPPEGRVLYNGDGRDVDRRGRPVYSWMEPGDVLESVDWHSVACPYGVPGGTLWVREAFRCERFDNIDAGSGWIRHTLRYRADRADPGTDWRPSIHMPRWASRLTLEVTEVRVERVQEIDEADAKAEGVEPVIVYRGWNLDGDSAGGGVSYVDAFAELWDKINGPRRYGWDSNPWVWVVSFRRIGG